MRHEVIIGVERRRRWTDDQKLSILMEVGLDGATVSEVARLHDITRQHIYQWRHELRRKGLWPCSGETVFLALDAPVTEQERSVETTCDAGMAEIVLKNGRVLRRCGGIGEADLTRLIRIAESA